MYAFGELHNNLIYEVFQHPHLSRETSNVVQTLYTNIQTPIITEQLNTAFIAVGRGVLQGDCHSPLLLICLSIRLFSIKNLRNTPSLAFGNFIKLLFRAIPFIVSSSQTTRLSSAAKKRQIEFCSTFLSVVSMGQQDNTC